MLLVLAILLMCCCLLLPCLLQVRDGEAWIYSSIGLRNCAMAMRGYHELNGHLPPAVVKDNQGRPLYSWRVLLLPFVVEDNVLYEQFHLNEAWDSPHNLALVEKMPKAYCWPFGGRDELGMTRYQVLVGPGTAFERDGLTFNDFPDGTEYTILVVESDTPVPWTKPVDVKYDPSQALPAFTQHTKPVRLLGKELWRKHGFIAGFADGKTHFIRADTPESTIRALITRNGGEKIGKIE